MNAILATRFPELSTIGTLLSFFFFFLGGGGGGGKKKKICGGLLCSRVGRPTNIY
eukprot:COSAG03_NODE_9782_length_693_cov_2251.008418_1_plen_54_part_01